MSALRLIAATGCFAAAMLGLWPARTAVAQQSRKCIQTPQLSQASSGGWLETSIVVGRIVVEGRRFGSAVTRAQEGGPNEQLTITAGGAAPTIAYRISGPEGDFSLDVSAGKRLHIRQVPKDGSGLEQLDFRQLGEESISLTVGSGDGQKAYTAKSLWHLLIAEPDVSREYLVSLLEPITHQDDLMAQADRVVAALTQAGAAGAQPDRQRWAKLVAQLGDDHYWRREAADRQLREAGPIVVTFLGQLDHAKLDAEQKYRVRRIIQALADSEGEDTPELVASRLAGDPAIWLALLGRDQEPTRRQAAAQMEALLGKPIDFDPAADPQTRQRQIDALRAVIADHSQTPSP